MGYPGEQAATAAERRRRVHIATVEAEATGRGERPIAFGLADEWRVLVTMGDRPLDWLALPDPGDTQGEGIVDGAVRAACDVRRRRLRLADDLKKRMGAAAPAHPDRSISVIVCTRGRVDSLRALLAILEGLDPAPDEIVVVDNAPPAGEDCRQVAEAAGAAYVREDALGLNNARRAGVGAATSELLAFADDDCLPAKRWLAPLRELFDDPVVGAVTGPTLPAVLDTPSRLRFEEVATFSRGFQRLEFDWANLAPAEGVRCGAGANMVFRRSLLDELGDVFPPELDAGTPTRSGGDHYAFYRVLAAGKRIIYDPRLLSYHLHRADPAALDDVIRAYGVGLSAVATKVLVEDGELTAVRIWRWIGREYLRTVVLAALGRVDRVDLRMRWNYVRGGLAGPAALFVSRRRDSVHSTAVGPPPPTAVVGARDPRNQTNVEPEVSVVVVTRRPGEALDRCLAALDAQDEACPAFEVLVVDDSGQGAPQELKAPAGLALRRIATAAAGTATARNAGARAARGELLLFLDEELVATRELVARHAAHHRAAGADLIVVGYSPPRPTRATLAAQHASLWWEDHFRATRDAVARTFVDVLGDNMSVRRRVFERIGAFDAQLGSARREDREWGIRALRAGADVAYEPAAVALRRFSLETRDQLAATRAEGRGDALLLERYPSVLPALELSWDPPPSEGLPRLAFLLLRHERLRSRAISLLDVLERFKLRDTWAKWYLLAQKAAYVQGFYEDGGRLPVNPQAAEVTRLELDSDRPLPRQATVAPWLELTVGGQAAGTHPPPGGRWDASVAERIAERLPVRQIQRIDSLRRARPHLPSRLDEVTVLLAGATERRGGQPAAAANGTEPEVQTIKGATSERWELIDRAIRTGGRPFVALPLPGTAIAPGWLDDGLVAFEGPRVAAVVGGSLPYGESEQQLTLCEVASQRVPYPSLAERIQYMILRRSTYVALGGFAPWLARFGDIAPVVDLMERALNAGWIIGRRDVSGLSVPEGGRWAAWRIDWELGRARGALIAGSAPALGPLWLARWGPGWIAAGLWRCARQNGRARQRALAATGGFVAGFLHGAVERRPG